MSLTWMHHVVHGRSRKRGKDTKTLCIGLIYNMLNGKDWSSIKQDRTQSSFTTHSQLIVSRKLLWWNLEKSYTRKYMRHLDLLQRFPSKIIWWKNWIQKLLETVKTPNKSNQNQKTQLPRTERLVKGPPFSQSCVPVSVERVDKDEDVDADQTRTGRPVSGQSFTQLEELDIDFRVPGMSHAVVKKQEISAFKNSSRTSEVILIEKHFKPICCRITSTTHSVIIRKRWSVNWAM